METVLKAISDWIKSLLTAAIMSNLSGLFDDVNTQVGNIAQQVGTKPSSFEPRVFAMIEALSRNVVLPIAGVILTFIACYELIEMITQHNNMAQFEPALLMKWIFKTAISVWLISNTFDIIMAVFDVTQQVVANSSGIISGNTRVNDIGLSMLQSSMMQMDVGPLFGLFLQSFFIIRIRLPRRGWKCLQVNMYRAAIAALKSLAEQTAQQGDQGDADEGNAAASHELLHALTLGGGVIAAVTFQQVDSAPHAETGTQSDNQSLKNFDSRVEEFHSLFSFINESCRPSVHT